MDHEMNTNYYLEVVCSKKAIPILLIILLVTLAWAFLNKTYSYWTSRQVKGKPPIWIIGNSLPRLIGSSSMAEYDQHLYTQYGGSIYCGLYEFLKPVIMVGDLELLKSITIKDFDHFTDRSYFIFNKPVMDLMLLGLKGAIWKRVRGAMTPTFSSMKIKKTFPLVQDCSENLVKYFNAKLNNRCTTFEMKEVYEKFTMDTIASIAFGVNSDSLNNSQDEFTAAAARFFAPEPTNWKEPMSILRPIFLWVAKALKITKFDITPCDFFTKVISDTINYRLTNGVRRNDFLQLLLDASIQEKTLAADKSANYEQVLSELVITAQCLLFFIAGYDTTATTLSFVSYCLALNPGVQQKVMQEVDEVYKLHKGQITYETMEQMKYLDMVFAETLRLYPPAPRVDRTCTKDYRLPGTNLVIPKGMKVIIPIYSIHRDPKYYDCPEKFDPERFSPENKANRPTGAHMPFGQGPRNCIGGRFALMEAKLVMIRLLKDFAFIPSHKTEIPISYDCSSGLLKASSGIWVRLAIRT